MSENRCGIIFKALSGFYYVESDGETVECRARGRFRLDKITPLVGDRVEFSFSGDGKGYLTSILDRRNVFIRPPVANIDVMVVMASAVIPVTDPYLIDRITAVAAHNSCECVICINKCDMDRGDWLYDIYSRSGYVTIRTSAETGEGVDELSDVISGRVCAFTGNSGVGKSSILNALEPGFAIRTGSVSDKLGRGRHTTRHVELYRLSNGAVIADTPGFSSFDTERADLILKEELQYAFPEFGPYIDECRFADCSHTKELGCAVLEAVRTGEIQRSRHNSYVSMYEAARQIKEWELDSRN